MRAEHASRSAGSDGVEAHARDDAPLPMPLKGLLNEALSAGATDVHIDPVAANSYRICFRVDGKIHGHAELQRESGQHMVNQVKVAANVTPDRLFKAVESRILPQGEEAETEEMRVTVMPTSRGDAAHLRVLSAPRVILEPEQLGLSETSMQRIRATLRRPEGLILVTGATGTGKSMTLYSLLSLLELQSVIAASIEDPVEYDLPYIRQVQVNSEQGLTMYEGLRSLLRMDPDIVLVGEIRDAQSALTAVRAAASGRFVLATLHARDPVLAVEALRYYSVPRHLVGSTLRMVISQALVRRVCRSCAGVREPSDEERDFFASHDMDIPSQVPAPNGCEACRGYGYQGRIGLFEVVPFTAAMGRVVARTDDMGSIRDAMAVAESPSLLQDALQKVADGITSMEEIFYLHVPDGGDESL